MFPDKYIMNLVLQGTVMSRSLFLFIARHDCTAALRGTLVRIQAHAATTALTVLIMLPFMAAITGVSLFLLSGRSRFSDMVTVGDFFLLFLITVTGRAMGTSLRLVYRNPATELLRIIPIPGRQAYLGKLMTVMTLTMLTFSVFFLLFLSFFHALYDGTVTVADGLRYSTFIFLIAIFGTLTGFILPLVYYLPAPVRNRILPVVVPPVVAGALVISVSDLEVTFLVADGGLVFPLLLFLLSLIQVAIVLNMSWYFNEAMTTYLPDLDTERFLTPRLVSLISWLRARGPDGAGLISHSRAVMAKELLSTLRDRYFHIYASVTFMLTVMGIIMILSIPDEVLDENWGWLVVPTVVGFMLFIEGAFMVTLGSLSLIGKEGKRLWVFLSLPVSGYEVLHGKVVSVIIPSIIGGYALILPILAVSDLPQGQNVVFLILTLCVILAFSGIGILAGVTYPNFTEGARGSPEIVFQMFILFVCLLMLGFMVVPPMAFYYRYGTGAGVLASSIGVIFGYGVLTSAVRKGEQLFDRFTAEAYEG